ncbi:MAG: carboxypeptidase-like regulatory domain-containing protein [Cellulophaga sp.]
MKNAIVLLVTLFMMTTVQSQEKDRQILRGKVLYRNSNVSNENVINTTSEKATITNNNGEFEIWVREGDELVFTAVNYKLKVLTITKAILKRNRLVVEVNEKVTELDEVVVGPENQEKFIELKNEEFKEYSYEPDESSPLIKPAMTPAGSDLQNGINFVNLFKLIRKSVLKNKSNEKDKRPPLKVSDVLRQVYDDSFFVNDLSLPQEKIDDFLFYCDAKMPAQELLKKDNEFQLIDFLVTHSKNYLKVVASEK